MKKVFIVVLWLCSSIIVAAKENESVKLLRGNARFVTEDVTAFVNLDFSNAVQVHYDTDNTTVEEVEGKYVERDTAEWNEDLRKIHEFGVNRLNKIAKKGKYPVKFVSSPDEAQYELHLRIDTLDAGNVAAAFAISLKGGAILVGELTVRDIASGEEVCVISYDHLKHPGGQGIEWIRIANITYRNAIAQFLLGYDPVSDGVKKGERAANYPLLYPKR